MKKALPFILILAVISFITVQIRFDLAERKYVREINSHTIILQNAIIDLIKFDQSELPAQVKHYTTEK